jgi:uncharacterized protein
MPDIYLHGIETLELNNGPRPIRTIDTGIIGLIGTAPLADALSFPLNKPVVIYGQLGALNIGTTGTLPDCIADIIAESGRASQTIVVVRVAEGASAAETMGNIIGSPISRTGVHAFRDSFNLLGVVPKILIATGWTSTRPTNGVLSGSTSVQGTGYLAAPTVTLTGGGGFGAQAIAVINATGNVTGINIINPGSGYTTAPVVSFTPVNGGTGAVGAVVLGTVANPVTKELLTVAARLRAVVIKDGPDTTATAAILDRGDYNTDRLFIVDPKGSVFSGTTIVNRPVSAMVAGLGARIDYEEGFWVSWSNHEMARIVGTSRVIDHSLNDPSVESQQLNKNGIAVIVRAPSGGWKLFGNEVPSNDTLKKFLSVRRAHDTIIESIEIASEPFIDKPFGLQTLTDIAETVNNALRRWKGLGATLGGRVWLDPVLNTKENWATGHLYVSYDAEAPAPMQQITFVFNRNTGYYTELAERAMDEVNRIVSLVS